MEGPRDYHAKWSNSDRKDKYHTISLMWNLPLKQWYKWAYLQNRKTHRFQKQTYGYQRANMDERDKLGVYD